MAEAPFHDGAIVRLQSGGPMMTVMEARSDGLLICRWFDDATLKSDAFASVELVSVTTNEAARRIIGAVTSVHDSDYAHLGV